MEHFPVTITIKQDGATVYVSAGATSSVAIDATDFPTDRGWRLAIMAEVKKYVETITIPE